MTDAKTVDLKALADEINRPVYSGLDNRQALAEKLLHAATRVGDDYYRTFAMIMIVGCYISARMPDQCRVYISEAERLCRTNGYDRLLVRLCNLNGMYYDMTGDPQSSLRSYLSGIDLAKKLGDHLSLAKLYNNLGELFSEHKDRSEAKRYYLESYSESCFDGIPHTEDIRVIPLSNLVDCCRLMGDLKEAEHYLELCQPYADHIIVQVECATIKASLGEKEAAIAKIDEVLAKGFGDSPDRMFLHDALSLLCQAALICRSREHAERLLDMLRGGCRDDECTRWQQVHYLYICYLNIFGLKDRLPDAYREFYMMSSRFEMQRNRNCSEDLKSGIMFYRMLQQRDAFLQHTRDLESLVYIDELTGLFNRRYFNKLLERLSYADRLKNVGFIMLDLDCFKQFNDFYGHAAGDDLLRSIGNCLSSLASEQIKPCRYGGDEFVCICTDCTDDEIDSYIAKVREELALLGIAHAGSLCDTVVTISVGYSNRPISGQIDAELIMRQADTALYASKQRGRNSATRFSEPDML